MYVVPMYVHIWKDIYVCKDILGKIRQISVEIIKFVKKVVFIIFLVFILVQIFFLFTVAT